MPSVIDNEPLEWIIKMSELAYQESKQEVTL